MSETIIVENIDGIEVIRGFGRLAMDPFETNKIANEELKKTSEYEQVKNLQKEIYDLFQLANIKKKAKKHSEFHEIFNQAETKKREELLPAVKILRTKNKEIIREHAVYMEPGKNSRKVSDAQLLSLKDKFRTLSPQGFLDLTGKEIVDYRDEIYWEKTDKWRETKIKKIGEIISVDGIYFDDLSDSQLNEIDNQINRERIIKLPADQKEKEKLMITDKMAQEAAIKKVAFVIQGDSDDIAMTKVTAWYDEQLVKINIDYA